MHKLLLYSIAILVAIFFFLPCVEAFNLYDYFPNLVPGQDPGQPDTVYVVCSHQTTNQQVIQVRLKTDNINMFDSIGAALIPLLITADQPGAILDTTVATVFSGTAVINMDFLSSDVYSGGGRPGCFPNESDTWLCRVLRA